MKLEAPHIVSNVPKQFIDIVFIEVLPQLFHRRLRALNMCRLGSVIAVVGRRRRFLSLDIFPENLFCPADETDESAATLKTRNNGNIGGKYDGNAW